MVVNESCIAAELLQAKLVAHCESCLSKSKELH